MLRFTKPNGDAFDLDYTGVIFCRDSGNDIIAVCDGGSTWFEAATDEGFFRENTDGGIEFSDQEGFDDFLNRTRGTVGEPDKWDDWRIVINVKYDYLIQRAISLAYTSAVNAQRLLIAFG